MAEARAGPGPVSSAEKLPRKRGYGQWLVTSRLSPFSNLPLKLFALLLAIVLWMLAAMGNRENIRLPVDLNFTGLRDDLIIISQTVEKLDVTVSGPSRIINELTADKIKVSCDLSGVNSPKELTVRILPEQIDTPPGTTVVSVMPSSVVVKIGNKKVVTLPVTLQLKGKPPADYEIVGRSTQPATVTLEGPETVLADVRAVKTEPINVKDATQPFTSRAYLLPIHPLVRFVTSKSVLVKIDIREKIQIIKVHSVPVQQIPPERPVSITPARINIDIKGPVSVLRRIKNQHIVGIVDVRDLGPGSYLRTPRFALPTGAKVISRDPDKVTITIGSDNLGGK